MMTLGAIKRISLRLGVIEYCLGQSQVTLRICCSTVQGKINMEGQYKLKNESKLFESDHRPVFSIVEVDYEKQYIGNPPLYLRKHVPDGIFKIKEIDIEYDLKSLFTLTEQIHLNFPFEVTLFFSEDFLKITPSSSSWTVEKVEICL